RVAEPRPRPRFAAVGGAEHAVPGGHVAAQRLLASPDIHHVGIRAGHRDRADGAGAELAVAQRTPRLPAVRRLPDAAARRAEVEDERLAGIADDRVDAAAAERTDLAPAQAREPARIRSCRGGWSRSRGRRRAATGWPLRGGRGSDENGKHNKDRTTAHR